jgi:DNA-binding NtrC family response regulator
MRNDGDWAVGGPETAPARRATGAAERPTGEEFDLLVEVLYGEGPIFLKEVLDGLEKRILVRSLGMAGGNRKEAAGMLGLKYTTFHEKLRKFGIRPPKSPYAF